MPVIVPAYIAPSVIIESVAATMGTTAADIHGAAKPSNLNAARQICCLLFQEFTLLSRVEMGVALKRPNTSGGWRLLKLAGRRLDDDKRFYGAFEQARQRLVEGLHRV